MDSQPETPSGAKTGGQTDRQTDRRRDGRRRQLIAGIVAVVLTAFTAIAAISINFGAASADMPSKAGEADRSALETRFELGNSPAVASDEPVDPSATTSDIWGRPQRSYDDDQKRDHDDHDDEHDDEHGHDDDD
ncbi:MAG TPA: hypothetical protein VL068_01125 [Microthrixaceae bacterium]|nr:hypothetical protein [Microthrixaceae bacterium]